MWATVSGTGSAAGGPLLPPPPEAQEDAANEEPPARPPRVQGGMTTAVKTKVKPVPAALRPLLVGEGPRRPSLKDPVPQFAGAAAEPVVNTEAVEARKAAEEEFEKRKLRLACKMEIVNFYGGCCAEFGKMTAAQNKELQKRLRSSDADAQDKVVGQFCEEREAQIKSWSKKADDPKGVQRRLAKLSGFCGGGGSQAQAQAQAHARAGAVAPGPAPAPAAATAPNHCGVLEAAGDEEGWQWPSSSPTNQNLYQATAEEEEDDGLEF